MRPRRTTLQRDDDTSRSTPRRPLLAHLPFDCIVHVFACLAAPRDQAALRSTCRTGVAAFDAAVGLDCIGFAAGRPRDRRATLHPRALLRSPSRCTWAPVTRTTHHNGSGPSWRDDANAVVVVCNWGAFDYVERYGDASDTVGSYILCGQMNIRGLRFGLSPRVRRVSVLVVAWCDALEVVDLSGLVNLSEESRAAMRWVVPTTEDDCVSTG